MLGNWLQEQHWAKVKLSA